MRPTTSTRCLILALCCAIFAFSNLTFSANANPLDGLRNSISSLWTQKSARKQKAQAAWNRAQTLNARARQVHVHLESSQRAFLQANAFYVNYTRQTKKTEANIVRTRHRVLVVSQRLKRRRILMGRRLSAIQRAGKLSYLQLFLGSRSLSDLTRRATVFQAITDRDSELQNAIEGDRDELLGAHNSLMSQWQSRNKLKQAAFREWRRVAQIKGRQDNLLRQLNASRAAQVSYAQAQEDSSRDITRLIQRLALRRDRIVVRNAEERMQLQRLRDERLGEARLNKRNGANIEYSNERVLPSRGESSGWGMPASGGITSPFGMRFHPILHRVKLHTGTDFGPGYGAPIYAAKSGTVIFAGWQTAYGNMVIIEHGGGFSTLYGHASSLSVSSGQSVRRGQHIANVGSTGFSTGPHLHFEIRINGEPVNPMRYLN